MDARVYLILICLFTPSGDGFAQAAPRFERLATAEGLSNPGVGCMTQDREGFLWFGTRDGLNRFDGYAFKIFKHDLYDPAHTLPHNWVLDVIEARDGTLWISTAGGLCRMDKRTGRVTSYRVDPKPGNEWDAGNQLLEDRAGTIWMGSSRGLVRFDPRLHRLRLYPSPARYGSVQCLREDRFGRFWAGTEGGLCRFDPATGRFGAFPVPYALPKPPNVVALHLDPRQMLWVGTEGAGLFVIDTHLPQPAARRYQTKSPVNAVIQYKGICPDGDSLLWLGTSQGLQRVNRLTREVITYRANAAVPDALSGDCVLQVLKDRSGMLWIGTCQQGVNRLNLVPPKFGVFQFQPTRPGAVAAANSLQALLEDRAGITWLGVTNQGLFRVDPRTRQPQRVPLNPEAKPATNDTVMSLHEDRSGRLWVGTPSALVQVDPRTGTVRQRYPTDVEVNYLDEAPDGRLWLAGNGGVGQLDEKTGRFRYFRYRSTGQSWLGAFYVSDLEITRTGEAWIGHGNGGITRLDTRRGRVIWHRPDPGKALNGALNDVSVRTIYEDTHGTIWVGTNQGGLNRYDSRTQAFRYVTTHLGLPSNYIASITDDSTGHLWLGTDNGLCRYNAVTGTCRTYGLSDYLPSSTFQDGCVHRRGKRLLFGTDNGLVVIEPARVRTNAYVPPVWVTELRVMHRPLPVPDRHQVLELPHDQNVISFEFAALNYESTGKNQYAYQLVGTNDGWVFNGTSRTANFTNLDPGAYEFRVKASNNDGIWNERGASVRFVIRPPWWRTWWAVAGYSLLGMGGVWAFSRYQVHRARQAQELAMQHREAEQLRSLDELKTRFFANVTHELRTPLTLILSPTESLLHDPATTHPVVRTNLNLIRRNARHLLALINQLLDLSKLEAAQMGVAERPGNLGEFLAQVVELFQPLAESRRIALTFEASPYPAYVLFDPEKWQRILSNLLSNGLKFTPEGGQVAVCLTGSAESEDQTRFRLVVTDSGVGIPAGKMDRIFDRFYQADTSPTRAFGGTGIGLALVKELTERMGGRVGVVSAEGQGARFWVEVPLRPATEASPTAPLRPAAEPTMEPDVLVPPATSDEQAPVVLVVEDSTELRQFLARELAPTYQILTAENGHEGYNLARRELPDVVISDVTMPFLDGCTLTHRLKTDPLTAHVGVILLTARATHEGVLEGLEQGADDYLTKPFDLRELRLRLENQLSRRENLRRYHQQQLAQPEAAPAVAPDPFLEKMEPLLENHLANSGYGAEELAHDLNMSRRTLHRKMKALTDLSPSEYLRRYRLRRAAQLLREGHTVAEVAFRVGYESQTHFSAVFKEFYQTTPSEYAKR